jgi:PAS domain S-box-containing protein
MDAAPTHNLDQADLWLVASLAVPASLHDVQGHFVYVNEAAERASGISNAQWLGRHYTEPLPPEARENVEAQFRRAAELGEPTDFETAFVDATGQLRAVRAQHLPLRSGGAIVGVLILAFDVREPFADPVRLEREPRLTPRQGEILELMADGLSTAQIAERLMLSTETVRNHVRRVLMELQVHTRLEAIAVARRLGLLAPLPLRPLRPEG